MIPQHIETWDANEDLACSIYLMPDETITTWFKVGSAAFEVKGKDVELLSEFIDFIKEKIKEALDD